jgi:hypothetical protein
MNISWILANGLIPDPELDLSKLKEIGPFWGGWQTWRSCGTDNVICNDFDRAQSLLARKFKYTICLWFFMIPHLVLL